MSNAAFIQIAPNVFINWNNISKVTLGDEEIGTSIHTEEAVIYVDREFERDFVFKFLLKVDTVE